MVEDRRQAFPTDQGVTVAPWAIHHYIPYLWGMKLDLITDFSTVTRLSKS